VGGSGGFLLRAELGEKPCFRARTPVLGHTTRLPWFGAPFWLRPSKDCPLPGHRTPPASGP
jgi:hypothetical protein